MTTRREQTSHESSELILRAAAELFAEKGYRQTTFADVAERSGISRGSIPWHFGSKEGLLLAVLERSVDLIRGGLVEEPGERAEPEEVAAGFDRLLGGADALFAQPTTKLFVTLLVEALEPGSPIHGRYVEIHNTLRDHCRRWLERLPCRPACPPKRCPSPSSAPASASTSSGCWPPNASTPSSRWPHCARWWRERCCRPAVSRRPG